MRRVLYIHHCATQGGATLSLLYLLKELDRSKYSPMVLFNCPPDSAIELFRNEGVEVLLRPDISIYQHGQGTWLSLRSLRPWEIFTRATQIIPSAKRFSRFLKVHPFDIVHLNSVVQIPAALGAFWAGVPVIWHIREELHPGYFGLRRFLIRKCIERCATRIVVISKRNASQLLQSTKTNVIYNFVNFNVFDKSLTGSSFRRELGILSEQPVITMLGGAIEHKGADILIEAALLVKQSYPNALFVVAGVAPSGLESPFLWKRASRRLVERIGFIANVQNRVQELILRHNLQETIRFVGMRSDIPEILAASNMLIWPATVSHFARPIIEAGAMARSVIATDFPSSRELVEPGKTGLLFPLADKQALAEAIMFLLGNPDRAKQMGEAGYTLARQRYDAQKNAAATFAIYEQIFN